MHDVRIVSERNLFARKCFLKATVNTTLELGLHADLKLLRYFYGVPTYNTRRIMRSKASEISIRHAEPKEIAFVDIKKRKGHTPRSLSYIHICHRWNDYFLF